MSIEGGTSGGMGGIGSAVSVGPAISAGPSVGGFATCGETGSLDIGSSIVQEGPVGSLSGFSEFKSLGVPSIVNEGPLTPISLGSTEKNAAPVPAFDVIAEVESIILQAQKPAILEQNPLNAESVVAEARPWLGIVEPVTEEVRLPLRQPIPQISPLPELMPLTVIQPQTRTVIEEAEAIAQQSWENHPMTQAEAVANTLDEEEPAVSTVVVPEQIEEEVSDEEETEEERKPKESFEEELIMEQKIYLEDEGATSQRKHEIREAIIKAGIEADRMGWKNITGWLVAKFLPGEHEGNRSQVVKKTGPDGSYQETIEAIAGIGELNSGEMAARRLDTIVDEKQPVRIGKKGDGKVVEHQTVARVYKYLVIKPIQPHVEVIKRVVKKKELISQPVVVTPISITEWKSKKESSLEELGLSEVFRKAA